MVMGESGVEMLGAAQAAVSFMYGLLSTRGDTPTELTRVLGRQINPSTAPPPLSPCVNSCEIQQKQCPHPVHPRAHADSVAMHHGISHTCLPARM